MSSSVLTFPLGGVILCCWFGVERVLQPKSGFAVKRKKKKKKKRVFIVYFLTWTVFTPEVSLIIKEMSMWVCHRFLNRAAATQEGESFLLGSSFKQTTKQIRKAALAQPHNLFILLTFPVRWSASCWVRAACRSFSRSKTEGTLTRSPAFGWAGCLSIFFD